jgi:Rod binding domain-containing protein
MIPPPTLALGSSQQTAGGPGTAIDRVARDFEAMAMAELLAPMFDSLDVDGLGGGGFAERMFRPMMVQNFSRSIADAGGVGLSDALRAQLIGLQGLAIPEGAS